MSFSEALLPEFDHEMAVTRRVLERVPMEDAAWKPHEKSMSIGRLATHLAEIPTWAPTLIRGNGYDMGQDGGQAVERPTQSTSRDLLAAYDGNVKAARELIGATSDAEFMEPWTLKDKGKEVFTMPKMGTVRAWLLSHSIHHRGQLSVYLRLRNIPVPAIYGPSADER
jgi:uncharacterized damage-inducible protein DinB